MHNYLLMQVFDRLSLFFCWNFDVNNVAAAGAHTKEGKAYYGSTIKPTSVKAVEIQLPIVDRQTIVVDPYPFEQSPLRVSVRSKLIPKVKYNRKNNFERFMPKQSGKSSFSTC